MPIWDEVVLQVEGLRAGYGAVDVLQGVDLAVRAGEFWGILGPNGSGKTTLLRCLAGVLRPRAGRVLLKGRRVDELPRREVARAVAVLPSGGGWLPEAEAFSVRQVVALGRYPWGEGEGSTASAVEESLALLGLEPLAERRLGELSGGERQRVFLARALAQEPRALLLDEPTAHLDLRHQAATLSLVRRLVRERGLAAVAVLHDPNLALRFCDRLLLLRSGRAVAAGEPAAVLSAENVRAVYGAEVLVDLDRAGRPYLRLQ